MKYDPLLLQKRHVLANGNKWFGYAVFPTADFDSDSVRDALSILRVIVFDDDKNIRYLDNAEISWSEPRANNLPPFDIRNELLAIKKLSDLCFENLHKYPRTLQGDRELLE